ncbi:maker548 [Drosophila busckii]|uniref:Maker548 n=1 Tax=Drosophila busckii TaxID=30019 RepID=A0A0M4ES65_DROBS|nr:maker548 [Drosophila busckii]
MNKDKQFEDKLIKFIDRAEVTSVPYGNDIQTIHVAGMEPFQVPFVPKFSGWVVIHRRVDDSVIFNRTWEEYKNGFGDLRGNFWLGLEKLHLMTKFQPHELYIQLEDFNNETRYARYTNFRIGTDAQYYELLSVGEYDGNAGNALDTGNEYSAKNMKFSTPERDNDKYDYFNCAAAFASGWWWNDCFWCKIINNEQETEITALKSKLIEHQFAKDTLLRHKIKNGADSKEQNGIFPAEATSCLAFGNSNDIQTIRVPGAEAFQVPCDSKFAGEGWTVIQRRMDGSVSFNQNWDEYRNGFGDLRGEFWLGLEKLYLMIKFQPHELYVELEDFKSEKQYARYSNFTIANEAQYYELLSVGKYTGNAGNALDSGMYGMTEKNSKFLTPDRNNDSTHECAAAMSIIWDKTIIDH